VRCFFLACRSTEGGAAGRGSAGLMNSRPNAPSSQGQHTANSVGTALRHRPESPHPPGGLVRLSNTVPCSYGWPTRLRTRGQLRHHRPMPAAA
jgi:hypothetical protein